MINIRKFIESDREALKAITVLCFDGVSIDQNVHKAVGPIRGHDWRWRKVRHIDADIAANADGIFVAADGERPVGYITTTLDRDAGIGRIPNLAVHPDYQGQGLGRRLIEAALNHMRKEGLDIAKIETLAQNDVGSSFYPRMGFREVARQIHYIRPLRDE